ncbi:MAG TPA: hypothetical protein VMS17_08725 [Gemmataceae bacterium]|nr:hypothetical protein [Gemmataceae bacterium]
MYSLRSAYSAAAVRLAAPLALLLLAGPASAEEFYYMAMFGAQTSPNNPDYSHTFATFVRASGEGPCPTAYTVEDCFTISWLPSSLKIRLRALWPECGHNFGLHETLRYALSEDEHVSMWGPYRIDEELFYGAARQRDVLESGQVRYQAIDSGYPTDRVSNCIHAVSSSISGWRVRVLSPWFGDTASWAILQRFRPHIINADETHQWVFDYLQLACYPITRRDFENPRRGPVRSAFSTMLGVER